MCETRCTSSSLSLLSPSSTASLSSSASTSSSSSSSCLSVCSSTRRECQTAATQSFKSCEESTQLKWAQKCQDRCEVSFILCYSFAPSYLSSSSSSSSSLPFFHLFSLRSSVVSVFLRVILGLSGVSMIDVPLMTDAKDNVGSRGELIRTHAQRSSLSVRMHVHSQINKLAFNSL